MTWDGKETVIPHFTESIISYALPKPEIALTIPIHPVHPSDDYSLLAATASQNVTGNPSRRLPEFYYRKFYVDCSSDFLLGDEIVTLGFTAIINSMDTPPLIQGTYSHVGHQNGVRDQDDEDYWKELREFFKNGEFPSRLVTDKARIHFRKRAHRFFLQNNQLWLAPKKNSDRLPRKVIEEQPKRQELLTVAHNECGHRGQDATYRCQRLDSFYTM
ncbi:hypothetical protein GGU10DRAFT_382000 [Lentinula aff. detonsa]|uniref:Integrase zinc-binding domain-containing protein n=1 Tax=Lentinula aff. detonsa TaxID=2804958 RepID=A0AA38NIV0_9AGAR|nr:hypothetical protein GGU10DRAFT_382000 [Lentinula aff. detonsa]